jgi:hypothetical protein
MVSREQAEVAEPTLLQRGAKRTELHERKLDEAPLADRAGEGEIARSGDFGILAYVRPCRAIHTPELPAQHFLEAEVVPQCDPVLELLLHPDRTWFEERCRHDDARARVLGLHCAE